MKETLVQLRRLQDLTRRTERLQSDGEALSADVRVQERLLAEKKRQAEQAHYQHLEAAKQADATELKIEEAEEEIRRLRAQLNVTKSQSDYDAIRRSVLSHEADIRKWEDEGLAALQAADELAVAEREARREVEQAEQDLREMRTNVEARQAELERRIEDVREQCEVLRRQLNPDVLSAYDRLTGHKGGAALAVVRDRVCQGCFTRITKQSENRLMHGREIVYCQSCGRMLMLDEAESAGETVDARRE
jgi:predicted  nucleic acid-binding Zn-ribbon protein